MAAISYDEVRPALHINVDASTTAKKHFLDITTLGTNLPKGSQRFRRYDDVYRLLSALRRHTNPCVHFNDPLKKLAALQDALDIMFYEEIIMEVLIESSFFSRFLQLREQQLLVTIMAYDFQKHKFCQRPPHHSESIAENLRSISEALWSHRVKLSATLARMRVSASAQSISQLLPPLKQTYYSTLTSTPVYARVTCSPTSDEWTMMISELQSAGISFIQERSQLKSSPTSATFITKDLLAFSPNCRSILYNSGLREGPLSALCLQDFTSYMAIEKLSPILQSLGEDEKNVIITNCDSGVIPAHVSSLMKGKGKVIVFGAIPMNIKVVEATLTEASINNVQLIPASFPNVDPSDDMFDDVGLILCNVPCSLTSILHPIDYILQEGDQCMAQVFKTNSPNMPTLLREQKTYLSHSLKFNQIKYLVYFTRSNLTVENKDLVDSIVSDYIGEDSEITADDGNPADIQRYEIQISTGIEDKGYLCVLKQLPHPEPAPCDVIAEAILKGVLSAEGIHEYSQPQIKKTKKKTKKRIFSQHDGIPMTFAAQQKVVRKRGGTLERRPFLM